MIISLLHTDPYVLYVPSISLNNEIQALKQYLTGKQAYFLIAPYWNVCDYIMKDYTTFINNTEECHKVIILTNTLDEQDRFNNLGVQNIWCSHNAFVDPNIFNIIDNDKQYKAIYNARFNKDKRHHLAKKIDNLACITWGFGNEKEKEYLTNLQSTQKITILNEINKDKIISKKPHEVNTAYSLAYTGLCLSSAEGAMYSSIEYLLAGLPIVSTRSRGGRDVFFNEYNSTIVEDNEDAVLEAVDNIISHYDTIDRQKIRNEAITVQESHLDRFKKLIISILNNHNINIDMTEWWNRHYVHKMVKWYPDLDSFLRTIPL